MLASAMGLILANAFEFIDQPEGFVSITIDDVPTLLPPQGYEALATTRNISFKIEDSGVGMPMSFLKKDYFMALRKKVSQT